MDERIREAVGDLLENLNSAASKRAYEGDWAAFCKWLDGEEVVVEQVVTRDVQRYFSYLRDQKYAKSSRGRALSVVREMYGALVRAGIMEINPAREVKNPRIGDLPRSPWLSEEQIRALLNVSCFTWEQRRDRLCIYLLFGLGWRRSEIARICIEDFDRGTIAGVLKGSKEVTVGVPAWVQQEIDSWCAFAGIRSGPLLPRAIDKAKSMTADMVYNAVHRVALLANVPEEVSTPHAIRRSYITLGGERGVDLKQRQLAVGHASQATTERYDKARDAAKNAPGQIFADLVREGK